MTLSHRLNFSHPVRSVASMGFHPSEQIKPFKTLPLFHCERYNGAAEGGNGDEACSFACGSVLVGGGKGFGSNCQVLCRTERQ